MITSETEGVVSDPDEDVAAALDSGEVIDGVLMMTVVDEGISTDEDGVGVDSTPDEEAEDSGVEAGVVSVAVTGQIVVETGMTTVVRTVERAGQLITSGPQLMTVDTDVVKTVEVVS